MLSSTIKILAAAKRCFYRHGYSATTISMISKYADVSRVTIHKQFCSKEQIFRNVLENFVTETHENAESILCANGDCWQKVELLLQMWGDEIFKEINDEITRNDLIYSAKSLCADVLERVRESKCNVIAEVIAQGVDNKEVCLLALDMTIDEVADLIETSFTGVINTLKSNDSNSAIASLLKVYIVATKPH